MKQITKQRPLSLRGSPLLTQHKIQGLCWTFSNRIKDLLQQKIFLHYIHYTTLARGGFKRQVSLVLLSNLTVQLSSTRRWHDLSALLETSLIFSLRRWQQIQLFPRISTSDRFPRTFQVRNVYQVQILSGISKDHVSPKISSQELLRCWF